MATPSAVILTSDAINGIQLELFGFKPRTATRRFIVQICEGFPGRGLLQAYLDAVPADPTKTSAMPYPGENHPSFIELKATTFLITGLDVNLVQIDVQYRNFEDFFISGSGGLASIPWYRHIIDDGQATTDGTPEGTDTGQAGSQILVQWSPDGGETVIAKGANIQRLVPEGVIVVEGNRLRMPAEHELLLGRVNAFPFLATPGFPGFPPYTLMFENINFRAEHSASFLWWETSYSFRIRPEGWYEYAVFTDRENKVPKGIVKDVGIKRIGMGEPMDFSRELQLPSVFYV